LTVCKINRLQKVTKDGLQNLDEARKSTISEFNVENVISVGVKQELILATSRAKELTEDEVRSVREALDLIQNIRSLREERRVLAKEARS